MLRFARNDITVHFLRKHHAFAALEDSEMTFTEDISLESKEKFQRPDRVSSTTQLLTSRSTPYTDRISCLMNTVYDTAKQITVMAMRLMICGMTT